MRKIWSVVISVICLLGCCATLAGCKSREDCIPEKLGKAEGLYLYYDNYRSLTDGTQTERLLGDITVEGETYTEEEYQIGSLAYMQSEKEIFYCLETQREGEDSQWFLWHYNYDTKKNGWMRTLEGGAGLYTSDTYLLVKVYNNSGYDKAGYLYDGDLNCVAEDLANYNLSDDTACRYTDYKYLWWRNGQFFSVEVNGGKITWDNYLRHGKYAYLFIEDKVYAVDLDTGEYVITYLPQGEKFSDAFDGYGRSVVKDGHAYFITHSTVTQTEYEWDTLKTGCALWALNGTGFQRVYEFEKKYEVTFSDTSYDEQYINLRLRHVPKLLNPNNTMERKEACYGIKTKTMRSGKKATASPRQSFTVGEYEFYTSWVHYGALMGGSYCYYLHRITDGKDEIVQYYFEELEDVVNPILFEDIYVK